MPRFQILYLRENVLDHSEEIDVRDSTAAAAEEGLATVEVP